MAENNAPSVLEVYVNGQDRQMVSTVTPRVDGLWMGAADLAGAGIKIQPAESNADGFVNLATLSGLQVQLVEGEQRLDILADEGRLIPQAFDLRPENPAVLTNAGDGFIGKYDIVSTVGDLNRPEDTATTAATLGGNFFTPTGNFMSNGFFQDGGGTSSFVRLDSAAEFDQPDIMRRWIAGDAVSGGPSWARSVRFGGLQMASDFSMRPDIATFPLPAFFGQTAVPTTVDVFVNSARVFESNVDAGPFQITNLPIITGGGSATVVTHDILGRETTATLPFFASNILLRQGLSSYDLDAGFIRRSYGEISFDYGEPVTTGTYARGVNNWLTLEAHGEAAQDVQLAGAGAAFSLSPYGVLHVSEAASGNSLDGPYEGGLLHSLSFESQLTPFDFFGSASVTSGHYADIAAVGGTVPPKAQLQAGASVTLGDAGSLAASWVDVENKGQADSQLVTGSYTVSLGGRVNLAATALYDRVSGSYATEASLSIFLGDGYVGSASARSGSQAGEDIGLVKPVNPDGGFGYRLSASSGDPETKQAEATWIGSHGSLDGELAETNGMQAARLDVAGGVVAMGGSVFTTKTPNSAVALVHTGEPLATVYRENRPVAVTDEDGNALLTDLVPYTANRISIDPRDYKLSTIVDTADQAVVPGRQNGVVVDFTPPVRSPVLVILRMEEDGSFPPVGAGITLDTGGDTFVVGHHGEIFFPDLPQPVTGVVSYEGGACDFTIVPRAGSTADAIPRLGPVLCITERMP